MAQTAALTTTEQTHLAELEAVIETGLQTFYEVGNALAAIREARLYRADYATFEDYCRERWQMSRAYAYRMIGAAEVVENLSPIGDIVPPVNESQARPLTGLAPKQQRQAWQKANEAAGEGKVTAVHVRAAADEVRYQTAFALQMTAGDWLRQRHGGENKNGLAELSQLNIQQSRHPTWSELVGAMPTPHREQDLLFALGMLLDIWQGRAKERRKQAARKGSRGGLTKQAYAESLVPDLVEFLRTYTDKHGRSWRQIISVAAHTNSTPWQDITAEWKRRKIHFADDELKVAIKKALAILKAESSKGFAARLDTIDEEMAESVAEMLADDEELESETEYRLFELTLMSSKLARMFVSSEPPIRELYYQASQAVSACVAELQKLEETE